MNFDQEILKVLTLAGDKGLKTEKIARHVFNACNSMFSPLDFKDVHGYVSQFLIKSAKDPMSIIQKGVGHGVYHLDFKAQLAQQLLLKFAPHAEENDGLIDDNDDENSVDKEPDNSLSLFD